VRGWCLLAPPGLRADDDEDDDDDDGDGDGGLSGCGGSSSSFATESAAETDTGGVNSTFSPEVGIRGLTTDGQPRLFVLRWADGLDMARLSRHC